MNERVKLTLFVESEGAKRLVDVQAARNRLRALMPVVENLNNQFQVAQAQLQQFDTFCQTLDTTLGNASLVLEQSRPTATGATDIENQLQGGEAARGPSDEKGLREDQAPIVLSAN